MSFINAKRELLNNIPRFVKIKCAAIYEDDYDQTTVRFKLKLGHSQEELESFLSCLDYNYDNGYGGQHLFGYIWLDDGTWLERGEYDGSEWWEHKLINDIPEFLNNDN